MRIVGYLKAAKGAALLIVCLLIVQAFTDLSLPNLTSQIVDVGIQQSGIEHAAPDELRSSSFDAVAMMSSPDDEEALRRAYAPTDAGTYALTEEGSRERDELDAIVALPLAVVENAGRILGFDLDATRVAYEQGALTKEQVKSALASVADQVAEGGEALVAQQGIAAARAEYEALGRDLSQMQVSYLLRTGGQMLGLAAVGVVAAVLVGLIASRTAARIAFDLRSRLFSRVVSFSEADVNRFSAASLITRGTNDIQLIQMVTVMLLRMVLYAPILAIGGIVMITRTNASMAWIIVVAVIAVFALVGILFKVAMPKFKIMQGLIDRVNLVAREMLTGLPVIRAFDREDVEEARFDEASTALMRTQLFTNRVMSFMMPAMMLAMNAVSVAIVWVGGHYVDLGTIQTGDLIAFITYAMVIIMGFLMIGMISIMLPRADVAAQRVNEVIACEPTVLDPPAPRDAELPARTQAPGARIELKDVTFSYGDSQAPAVSRVSFVAEPGRTTALIGATGAGKSTVLKLIERFYDVTEGSVLLDGIDVRELSQHALRTSFGYVPQQSFLFAGSVADNVAYAAGGPEGADVARALSIAQADGFVSELPGGADAPISQGGTNVSGGQRQRLAIARALAAPARAYLFDDSFSALDYRTDAALRRALSEQLTGATVLIVAQRLATIMHADRIVVLDEGRVVGQGTHAELMASCDEYREIAYSQLSAAELEGGEAA